MMQEIRALECGVLFQGTLCLVVPTFGEAILGPLCENMTATDGRNACERHDAGIVHVFTIP